MLTLYSDLKIKVLLATKRQI